MPPLTTAWSLATGAESRAWCAGRALRRGRPVGRLSGTGAVAVNPGLFRQRTRGEWRGPWSFPRGPVWSSMPSPRPPRTRRPRARGRVPHQRRRWGPAPSTCGSTAERRQGIGWRALPSSRGRHPAPGTSTLPISPDVECCCNSCRGKLSGSRGLGRGPRSATGAGSRPSGRLHLVAHPTSFSTSSTPCVPTAWQSTAALYRPRPSTGSHRPACASRTPWRQRPGRGLLPLRFSPGGIRRATVPSIVLTIFPRPHSRSRSGYDFAAIRRSEWWPTATSPRAGDSTKGSSSSSCRRFPTSTHLAGRAATCGRRRSTELRSRSGGAGRAASHRPLFLYVHTVDPHGPDHLPLRLLPGQRPRLPEGTDQLQIEEIARTPGRPPSARRYASPLRWRDRLRRSRAGALHRGAETQRRRNRGGHFRSRRGFPGARLLLARAITPRRGSPRTPDLLVALRRRGTAA